MLKQRGFTMIELLITIVIIAILAAIAAPAMRGAIASIRMRGLAESITSGLQYARNEAVKQNQPITFQMNTDSSWIVTKAGTTIQSKAATEGTSNTTSVVLTGTNTVVFNPLGSTTAVAGQLSQINLSSTQTSALYRVTVGAGGNIKMCNPNVTVTTDPKYCS